MSTVYSLTRKVDGARKRTKLLWDTLADVAGPEELCIADSLAKEIKKRNPRIKIGPRAALEIIAAVGLYLAEEQ